MNFLLRMLGLTVGTAVGTAVKVVEDTREGMEQLGQVISGKSLASDIIKKSKNNCLIINAIQNPTMNILDWIKSIFIEKYRYVDYYHILDGNGNIKYKAKCNYFCNKSKIIGLYNMNDNEVGHLDIQNFKKDEDIKMCSISTNEEKIINLKKYKNSSNIYSNIEEGEIKIDYNKLNAYEYKKEKRTIGKLYITRTKKSQKYMEKYVLEYENKENEILGILLGLAIDLLNS